MSNGKDENEIRALLNKAWDTFWEKPIDEFRAWEQEKLVGLRSSLQQSTETNQTYGAEQLLKSAK